MILKLSNNKDTIKKIEELGGSIIYQDETILNVEFIGTSSAMDKVLSTWDDKSLLEVVRTGVLGLSSNAKTLTI